MTQRCRVCSHSDRHVIDTLLSSGTPDLHIAKQFGIEAVSVGRHRQNHILAPKIVNALDGRLAQQQQQQQQKQRRQEKEARQIQQSLEAFDQGDPQALALANLGMTAQANKIVAVEGWVKRGVARAVETGSLSALCNLASVQLRAIEVGSRLAMTGGYKPPSTVSPTAERNIVRIEMVFQNAGKTETISLTERPVIDGDLTDPGPETPVPSPPPKQKFQGSISDYWSFSQPVPDGDTNDTG
jgi:hypothetical protein